MGTNKKKPGKSKNALTQNLKRLGNRPGKKPAKADAPTRLEKKQAAMRARVAAAEEQRLQDELREDLFVSEYMKDQNGTQAVLRNGWTKDPKSAGVCAVRMLARDSVRAKIQQVKAEIMVRNHLTTERILAETMKVAYFNPYKFLRRTTDGELYCDFTDITEDEAAALGELKYETYFEKDGTYEDGKPNMRQVRAVQFKPVSKLQALELLGKYKKLWTEKHEFNGAMSLKDWDALLEDVPVVNPTNKVKH